MVADKKIKLSILILCLLSFLEIHPHVYDEQWIQSTLTSMTITEKIGQLFIVAAVADEKASEEFMQICPYTLNKSHVETLITDYHVGGIIFLSNNGTPETQIATTKSLQELNTRCTTIPLLVALDAEWGLSMRLKNTVSFPRNAILGAQKDYDLVYEMSQEIGRQLASIGVHMNLAPVVDVNSNPRNPVIGSRSFGDNPHDVALNGIAFARGLHDAGILSCAKHFPGHGDTTTDSHVTLPVVNHPRERLDSIELAPFIELINHQIPAIMTAHLAVPALEPDITKPASLSRAVVTDLLKNELQFTGLVITDGLGMRGASDAYKPGELELQALLAGNDILLCPLDVPKAALLIEQAITDGHFAEQELNHRVEKILRAKAWAFNHHPESVNPVYDYKQLHTPHAYALQKRFEHVPAQSSTFIPAGH